MQRISNEKFNRLYSGKRAVIGLALINHDPFDQFAWCQEYRFAICDYLVWEMGEYVEDFRSYSPEEDSYAFQELKGYDPDVESLRYALEILDRFRVWLGMAGLDY